MTAETDGSKPVDPAVVAAVAALLERQGEQPRGNALRGGVPTVAVYLPRALETLSPGRRRTYRSPLLRLLDFRPCLPLEPGGTVTGSPDCVRLGCIADDDPAAARRVVGSSGIFARRCTGWQTIPGSVISVRTSLTRPFGCGPSTPTW